MSADDDTTLYTNDILAKSEVRLALAIVAISLCLVGAMGNGAVIYILLCGPRVPMSTSKLLVIVLAVFDFTVCIFTIPIDLADLMAAFHSSSSSFITPEYCKACSFFSLYVACAKFHIVLLISGERYILICHPYRASTLIDLTKVAKAIAFVLVLAFGLALPMPIRFITSGTVRINGTELAFCSWDLRGESVHWSWRLYYTTIFIVYYVAPLVATSFAYSSIFRVLYSGRRLSILDERGEEVTAMRVSLAKVMLSIAILFAVLNSPYFIVCLLVTFGEQQPDNKAFVIVLLNYLMGLNSVINPYIYCSHTYKSFFKRKLEPLFHTTSSDADNSKKNCQSTSF